MANPRRKISKSKRDMRRASWAGKLEPTTVSVCPNCNEVKVPHRACPNCGYYKGQKVTNPSEA